MKAVHLCDQKGWSMAPPLIDTISGLTATVEECLPGDTLSVGFFFFHEPRTLEMVEQSF